MTTQRKLGFYLAIIKKKIEILLSIALMYQLMYNSYLLHAGVAQLFRARPCQGRGQGLESPHPHHEKSRSLRPAFFVLWRRALFCGRKRPGVKNAIRHSARQSTLQNLF